MALSLGALRQRARTPGGQKAVRYMLVSAVSVAVGQVTLFTLQVGLHWTAKSANIMACSIGGVPSYYLNRTWAWGKRGRSHFLKELLPFWSLAFLGLVMSTFSADYAETHARNFTDSRVVQALIVNVTVILTFGILWVVKFLFFNKVFVTDDEELAVMLENEIVA
ncbi:MAG TPA: GtrA family protein [Acidimicrobiales bacterium]|nr:GtrA family protein [Acidimicrobiales bacterium]